MGKIENSKDLILLMLYAPGRTGKVCEPISGQTRLMKMIFLFKKELYVHFKQGDTISDSAFPNFEAYDYGPYSSQVYEDLEFLVNIELVAIKSDNNAEVLDEEKAEYKYWSITNADNGSATPIGRTFMLTSIGKEFVKEELLSGKNAITPNQLLILEKFKSRCVSASLKSLLHYVYSKYGDMTTKSKIKNQILGTNE